MITGEIAILFASAVGIGAATATWVCDRRLAKRLRGVTQDVENLLSAVHDLENRVYETDQAIGRLSAGRLGPLVAKDGTSDIYAKVSDDVRTDLAAPFQAVSYGDLVNPVPDAKHPLYATTGLPNQPVASLRPDTPARRCLVCGRADRWPGDQPCPNCGD